MGLFDWLFKRNNPPKMTTRTRAPAKPAATPSKVARPQPVSTRASAANRQADNARWVAAGQAIKIRGYQLPGGMLYTGTRLTAPSGAIEPALIDPDLSVGSPRASAGQDLDYWPSYHAISPDQRARYLAWLSSGRRDPSAAIGFVFLFMYGLERRVLIDIIQQPALEGELPAIRAEMTELAARYGPESRSFTHYAAGFIDIIDVVSARGMNRPLPPVELNADRSLVPSALRIELGARAANGQAIPANLALAWAWYSPDCSPRTPATRCKDEFARLFTIRFEQRYPGGMIVKPNKTSVKIRYQPASGGIGEQTLTLSTTPDVFVLKGPSRKVIDLFESVTNELEAYSRWLGRHPDQAGTLSAAALLPPELVSTSSGEIKRLRDWAEARLGGAAYVAAPASELIALWDGEGADRLDKSESIALAQLLGQFGFGIEPDVRFGGAPVATPARVVLFRLPPGASQSATPVYSAATTLVSLAVVVAKADGDLTMHELEQLSTHLEASLGLSPAEQLRLQAHLRWLTTTEIKLAGVKKRLEGLSAERRQSIGDVMIATASADGVISPGEVTMLTKLFRLLGLNPESVTSLLHASLTGGKPRPASQPVVVRPAAQPETGYRIPPPPADAASGNVLVLDGAAIQEKLAQTAEIAGLLESIFADEEIAPPPAPAKAATPDPSMPAIAGLDAPHSRLFLEVALRVEWSRADFEALAATLQIMPDGAIDRLNEAAYDAAGEPLLEGDDPITLNQYALEEMQP